MSILDRVREKFQTPMSGTRKTSGSPSAAFAGTTDRHLKSCEPLSAGSAGTRDRDFNTSGSSLEHVELPLLSHVQEAARQDVLARLEAHPAVHRAFVARWENEVLIVTLALRGVGTCELAIPVDRMGRNDLEAYGEILECLDGLKS